MLNPPSKPSHLFNVSSVFEVTKTLAPADNRNYTFRGTTIAITCDGWEGDNSREYDGTLVAYCGPMEVPQEDHCYALRAKMIPQVDSADFKLYYEAEHKIMVGTTDTFAGELNNNTGASGLGIVTSKHDIPEPNSEDTTLSFVMNHMDYSPELRESVSFKVEYRIRATQKLKKSQGIVQCGKETLVHGFIVDWDSTSNRWIVEVTALNVCTGPEAVSKKRQTAGTKVIRLVESDPLSTSPTPLQLGPLVAP
ncbi:uncharacterized protein MELLADRAFT_102834 [Melampsora larici-populina 98AG31]|uniref:Uncharacterized protein n=1 Tax=Melampsora larici-populina (strain 98AG31 / pathotype 3-4-7) TaxID=747676 RepID=F4R9J3_MELLP|nr:uncharacterized protein MELLADRAFT_102834 [Melampsora larici-populina 98AG31]EGG11138.1 hypothetical protein MELLADRAFT_102834 [Melampsora larici-populina 98AG31]